VYQPDFKQPLAYFVALHLARRVFTKGVPRICHGCPNSYYKCLIQLDAERLQRMLTNADGQAEAWFKALLAGKESDSECDGDGDGPLGPRPSEDNAPIRSSLPLPVLDVAPATGWERAQVSRGGTSLVLKVYADHFSHQTAGGEGRQRGWCDCPFHLACIRYRFCDEYESRELMCDSVHAWMLAGPSHPTKHEHLAHATSASDVEAVMAQLVCQNF
jgi:hypothetical protein